MSSSPTVQNIRPRRAAVILWQAMPYLVAVLLCLMLLTLITGLLRVDFSIPLYYGGGDGLLTGMWIKGMIDHGWYLHNPSVGAPFGLDMRDYAIGDNLHMLAMKVLALFTSNWAIVLNLYFLLTFPLTVITSMIAFRYYKLARAPSVVASILYAFLPFHFIRGIGHLFLSCYYLIPLTVLIVLWLAQGEPLFTCEVAGRPAWNWKDRKGIFSVVLCVLVASAGIYYAFFAGFFLVIAGLAGAVRRCSIKPLVVSAMLVVILVSALAINLSPTLIAFHENGKNSEVAQRSLSEPELYGLRIMQLILPVFGHRLPLFAHLKDGYDRAAVAVPPNENTTATLGLIGTCGFLFLLAWVTLGKRNGRTGELLSALSVFNISAVLLATMGGFSTAFAILITPNIRAYNRISPYIAFFCLFAVVIALDGLARIWGRDIQARVRLYIVCGALLIVGTLDQTTPAFAFNQNKPEFENDRNFIHTIESAMPAGAMIYQLPYIPFPETAWTPPMIDYDLFRAYAHSSTKLRWSYGAMRGRYGDVWQKQMAAKPIGDMVEALTLAGFSGIYVDRFGYPDSGQSFENKLSDLLQVRPLVSANGRLAFYNLSESKRQMQQRVSKEAWATQSEMMLHPLFLEWRGGFSGLETGNNQSWRWCGRTGDLYIQNTSEHPKAVVLQMTLVAGRPEPSTISVEGPGLSDSVPVDASGKSVVRTVTLLPGRNVIRFASDGRPADTPGDPRAGNLFFRLAEFRLSATVPPIKLDWGGGFSGLESNGNITWRWCASRGVLTMFNPSQLPREITAEMSMVMGSDSEAEIRIDGPSISQSLMANAAGRAFITHLRLQPGNSVIRFSCNAKPLLSPGDPRTLVFRIENFRYRDPAANLPYME